MLKNLSLTALIIGSLSGCSTVKVVHAELECPGIPVHNVTFTQEEKDSMPDSVVDKVDVIITTYKQRILSQCEIISAHNRAHK